ncbi:hypothetical protein [Acuticoccus sp. I52.16.1]|uniref:hypothetical protein n=1 Tax=Acuticoccus sp. I52.16.1 TaxID=2928472 RepID=UPI001FD50DC9|nr:hypothetical protein [Acuticoccus sp. I52.16.1]UOM33192.1 hypothetical protein MRB58_15130 [Acuticoccus sp. I52.16.1]
MTLKPVLSAAAIGCCAAVSGALSAPYGATPLETAPGIAPASAVLTEAQDGLAHQEETPSPHDRLVRGYTIFTTKGGARVTTVCHRAKVRAWSAPRRRWFHKFEVICPGRTQ